VGGGGGGGGGGGRNLSSASSSLARMSFTGKEIVHKAYQLPSTHHIGKLPPSASNSRQSQKSLNTTHFTLSLTQ